MWFFFFNDTATTEIYTLALHAALLIPRGRVPTEADSHAWREYNIAITTWLARTAVKQSGCATKVAD